jgi:ubiquinone/menaquinone biosynthesis C-methylase UbiE
MADAKGQVSKSAAEVYDEFFVPALFGEWAPRVCDATGVAAGHRVLDVACGTGVVAREAARRAGANGSVVGLDVNGGMLDVARRNAPDVEWREGRAESLPYPDASFDAVVSQFGMMFFEDRAAALREMSRVLRPGGRMAVAVWASLERSPGYAALTGLLQRLFGDQVATELRSPFVLGDEREFRSLFDAAGIANADVRTVEGTAQYPSLEEWVMTDVKGWTFAEMIDDAGYERLLQEARRDLAQFAGADGRVRFPIAAHIGTAAKP